MTTQNSIAKHAPGPWRATESLDVPGFWSIEALDSEGRRSADVAYMTLRSEHLEANARLIAAAPELLEALKHLATFGTEGDEEQRAALDAACAALAKAEGRA